MRTKEELDRLRERAIALRREGKSLREIKAILGPMSNSTLNRFLEGVPPPEWTRRARARDELRTAARDLRAQGLDYEDIAAALGVAKSSVSLWVRDLPTPPRLSYEEKRKRSAEGARRYWEVERTVRDTRRAAVTGRATAEIGAITDREILIAGLSPTGAKAPRASLTATSSEWPSSTAIRPDRIFPEVPRHGRHSPRRLDISRVHT